MQPLRTIDQVETPDGTLALKQRGERHFLITCDGRVLMNSTARRSEEALGTLACQGLSTLRAPRVLVGGLGMAFTLRAVLDQLPAAAEVIVAELNPITETWCRGPLASLTAHAVADPRVKVELNDVTRVIARAAAGPPSGRFDAIVIDLYVGPDADAGDDDRLYGRGAISQALEALTAGGTFAVWGERFDAGFARRLEKAFARVTHEKPGKGGLLHVVYVAKKR
jgi:spermidine synthase